MKLSEIADITEGKIEGNADLLITGIGKIETANENEITFISNPKYEKFFDITKAGCVIVTEDFINKGNEVSSILRVKDPYNSFLKLLEIFEINEDESLTGISEKSIIDKETEIGKNCKIFPNVTIYRDTEIGDNVIIHSGTVIGSDGFGFAKQKDTSYKKIPQTGNVVIESNVEIGSNTSIDRATIGETRICKGVKLDNQIQIAHNVVIGENTVIAAQVGIAGSTKIGKRCMIGGQSGIVGHLDICDDVVIGAAVGVSKSITVPGIYTGYRVRPYREDLKIEARIKNLDKLEERIKKLESSGK